MKRNIKITKNNDYSISFVYIVLNNKDTLSLEEDNSISILNNSTVQSIHVVFDNYNYYYRVKNLVSKSFKINLINDSNNIYIDNEKFKIKNKYIIFKEKKFKLVK